MKRIIAAALAAVMLLGTMRTDVPAVQKDQRQATEIMAEAGREKLNFNQGWKFVRQNIPEAVNVEYPMEELERWENVELPHSVRLEEYNNSGGKNYQGEAMYRKHFYLPESYQGKKLYLEFEAVMGVTDVWVNGVHLQGHMAEKTGKDDGNHTQYGGYLPFVLDVTEQVHCGDEKNVVTVLTDNRDNWNVPPGKPQGELDFTYFGGIYRNVWLHSVNTVHITDELLEDEAAGGGVLIDYPNVSEVSATAEVKTHIRNEESSAQTVTLQTSLQDADGTVVAEDRKELQIPAQNAVSAEQTLTVQNPTLWDLDHPYLHTLVSVVSVNGHETDRVETETGIRKITMSAANGMQINGKPAGFLSGVNRHQEYPYVGYAASDNMQRRDAIKYKSAGFNIVRTAHHPQAESFLHACDELGILVIEAVPGWQHWSDDAVFAERIENDIRQMIRRDRNHPSVVTFEISLNESPGVPDGFTNRMERIAKEEHPSIRTSAENPHNGAAGDILYGTPDEVAGWSGTAQSFIREYGDFWEEQFGGFENSCRVTRAPGTFYPGGEARMIEHANNRLWKGYSFGATGAISLSQGIGHYKDSSHRFAGMTMWIGIDHNRGYHETMSPCGLWDLMRIPKYSYYAFASQRPADKDPYLEALDVETGPMLFIASSWSEKAPVKDKANGETLGTDEKRTIYVYSNAEKVTLSVVKDGKETWSRESAPITEGTAGNLDHPPFCFTEVPYEAGSCLKAAGYDASGKEIAVQEVRTAGKPAQILLTADESGGGLTADGSDLVMVYAQILDQDGNLCQTADHSVKFSADGDGSIVGDGDKRVGANPVYAEAGMTGVLVQASKTAGEIRVHADAAGLESGFLTVTSRPMEEKQFPMRKLHRAYRWIRILCTWRKRKSLSRALISRIFPLIPWKRTGLLMRTA